MNATSQLSLLGRCALGLTALAGSAGAVAATLGTERLGLRELAPGRGSLAEAMAIFANNLSLVALLAGATLIRAETAGRVAVVVDAAVAAVAIANAAVVGVSIGALGADVLTRIAAHAPLELGGLALAYLAYLRVRVGTLTLAEGATLFGAGALALAGAAVVESYLDGRL